MLQGFPDGAIRIGPALGIVKKEGLVTYFVGPDNYFSPADTDAASQRFIIATLIDMWWLRRTPQRLAGIRPHLTDPVLTRNTSHFARVPGVQVSGYSILP